MKPIVYHARARIKLTLHWAIRNDETRLECASEVWELHSLQTDVILIHNFSLFDINREKHGIFIDFQKSCDSGQQERISQ